MVKPTWESLSLGAVVLCARRVANPSARHRTSLNHDCNSRGAESLLALRNEGRCVKGSGFDSSRLTGGSLFNLTPHFNRRHRWNFRVPHPLRFSFLQRVRPLLHLQHFAGDLVNAFGNRPAMLRPQRQRPQYQQSNVPCGSSILCSVMPSPIASTGIQYKLSCRSARGKNLPHQ